MINDLYFTGSGEQTSYVSYFPKPHEWDDKNGFCWLEWTTASENLFQSILTKNRDGQPPQTATTWRKSLRGTGQTRRLLETQYMRSGKFVKEVCPVRLPQ